MKILRKIMSKTLFTRSASLLMLAAIGLMSAGCGGGDGPPLTKVSGTVKLGGKPLPNATVTFEPASGKRPSYGVTDASGRYTLKFTQNSLGAVRDEHVVRISTWKAPTESGGTWRAGEPELVPAVYNDLARESANMKHKVTGGSATIDFDLDPNAGPIARRPELATTTANR